MTAYVVSDIEVTDPVKYEGYKRLAQDSIAKYGGKYLTRGGATTVMEGSWSPPRVVILEFPTVEQAKAWYTSPEYTKAKDARAGASIAKILIVEGLPPG